MEYLLILTEDDDEFACRTDERAGDYWAESVSYTHLRAHET